MNRTTFEQFLADHRRGEVSVEMANALEQLATDVRATGKAGSVTLKIVIEPFRRRAEDAVLIVDHITVKAPTPAREGGLFFIGLDGQIQKEDPRQARLAFESPRRGVPAPAPAPVPHDPVTGEVIAPMPVQAG